MRHCTHTAFILQGNKICGWRPGNEEAMCANMGNLATHIHIQKDLADDILEPAVECMLQHVLLPLKYKLEILVYYS